MCLLIFIWTQNIIINTMRLLQLISHLSSGSTAIGVHRNGWLLDDDRGFAVVYSSAAHVQEPFFLGRCGHHVQHDVRRAGGEKRRRR